MNTRKQVLIMSALLMLMLIVVGIYGAWYPSRETDAEEHFEEQTAERGAMLFARNCRLCHGDVGEGGSLGVRLAAAPALDRPDLQGFAAAVVKGTGGAAETPVTLSDDVNASTTQIKVTPAGSGIQGGSIIMIDDERMEVKGVDGETLTVTRGTGHTTAAAHNAEAPVLLFDEVALDPLNGNSVVRLITNTIACGRVGTAMPPWSQEHGGPLSDEQIRQLMTVITHDYWELVKEEVDKEDFRSVLTENVDASATTIAVADVTVFNEDEAIRIGDERMRIEEKVVQDGKSGILTVDRNDSKLKSTPFEHAEGDAVYHFPEAPEPAITQSSCGQTARPAPPQGPIGPIDTYTGNVTITVVAQGVQFDLKTISAPANTSIRVRLDNRDDGVDHNIAFYPSSTNVSQPLTPDSIGQTFPGPAIDDTVFTTPAAGNYFFRCDVHPTSMTGTFTVQ